MAPAAEHGDFVVRSESITSIEKKDLEDGSNSDEESVIKKVVLDYTSAEADALYDPEHFDPTLYEQPPVWYNQFSLRGALTVVVVAFFFSFIVLKATLQTGLGVPYSIPSGLLAYLCIKSFTKLAEKIGRPQLPFGRQENTAVQTAIVAACYILGEAGFGSSLFGLTKVTYNAVGGANTPGNRIQDTLSLNVKHVLPFLPILAFAGPLMLISFRKVIVIDLDLAWPTGTAVGILLNSIHSQGDSTQARANAARPVRSMLEWSLATFSWSITRWFFSGYNTNCGYENTPIFGMQAKKFGFYYDFRTQYIGSGFIVPYPVTYSMLVGGVISWGILWPILTPKIGDWYPISTKGSSSFAGLYGYQVLTAVALTFGDCFFQVVKVAWVTVGRIRAWRAARSSHVASGGSSLDPGDVRHVSDYDPDTQDKYEYRVLRETRLARRVRQYYFYKDNIPGWIGAASYTILTVVYCIVLPLVFHQVKWYYVLPVMVAAIPFAFVNAYATGLTNYSITSALAKLVILGFASKVGEDNGGLVVGLICGLLLSATLSNAVEMCQDFRTGYLTCSSAKAMVSSQLFGALVGCFIAPCVFYIFYNAYPIGVPGTAWPNPYAAIYRNIALLGLQGFDILPKHLPVMMLACFLAGFLMDAARASVPTKYGRFIPYPIAMATPFYLGVYLPIDYTIGAVAKILWGLKDPAGQALLFPAVATGLIIGDGMGSFPTAILSFLGYTAPMCIQWIPSNPKNTSFPSGY